MKQLSAWKSCRKESNLCTFLPDRIDGRINNTRPVVPRIACCCYAVFGNSVFLIARLSADDRQGAVQKSAFEGFSGCFNRSDVVCRIRRRRDFAVQSRRAENVFCRQKTKPRRSAVFFWPVQYQPAMWFA
ncbi:hypothetical protein [Undibacterium squillarum]|uniref:hypothetical protein n=1 Tax=Undibacterium squillarum TaxID=1131567 RepID=UPI00167A819B|nr:hypothetical protein [Undibacterium squillarum]